MRYYLDTEFDETPDHLVLISLALRAQDGRELYLVSSDFSVALCNPWVRENVIPHLHDLVPREHLPPKYVMPQGSFAEQIELFLCHDESPAFWGYYSAYDWVLFCRLWGGMLRMPGRFPKVCGDLRQLADTLLPGIRYKDACPPESTRHNAMADVRWNETLFNFIVDTANKERERWGPSSVAQVPPGRGVDTFIGKARSTL